jgi:hypothetical protein
MEVAGGAIQAFRAQDDQIGHRQGVYARGNGMDAVPRVRKAHRLNHSA